jgi:hypothetical protein
MEVAIPITQDILAAAFSLAMTLFLAAVMRSESPRPAPAPVSLPASKFSRDRRGELLG